MARLAASASAVAAALACPGVRAADARAADASPSPLDEVVVSASRVEQRAFDAPAAIQSIGRDPIFIERASGCTVT
ncbi:MAG TPA: hypothetical protein PKC20_05855, partial [Burkholderiaceae bacterium]|nr:hypothetical protein [Burkholderiaceae bacterium]